MVDELLVFGCSHTQGEGAEWPDLWTDKLCKQISPSKIYTKNLDRKEFVKFLMNDYNDDWDLFHSFATDIRHKNRWTSLLENKLQVKCTNYGFAAASNNAISDRILREIKYKNLSNKIVVFVSTYNNRLSFFNKMKKRNDIPLYKTSQELYSTAQGIEHLNYMNQKMILLSKLYVELLGGHFYTISFENDLGWKYDKEIKDHLGYSLLSEKSVVDYFDIQKFTRYDGHHFDKYGQKPICDIFNNFLKDKINE